MFDKIKKLFIGVDPEPEILPEPTVKPVEQEVKKPKKPRKLKQPKPEVKLSPKEEATLKGEPYISVLSMDIDPDNVNNGTFELDFNDKFILNLIRAGYKIKPDDTDTQIVDRWFQTVCRNIALEVYEQEQADPEKRDDVRIIRSRDIGNGRSEVS